MATSAAKKAAPAAAPKPAVKTAAKAAPAPAPAPVAEELPPEAEGEGEGPVIDVGSKVRFLGYPDDVAEEHKFLTAGEVYEVIAFTEPEGTDPGGMPLVNTANPAFDKKKREHPDTNPKLVSIEVLMDEIEVVEDEAEVAPEVAPVEEVAAPAPAPAAKKVAAVKAPKVAAEPVEPIDKEAVPDLTNEDAEVLALVEGSADLISTAQELEAQTATTEWQLGGLLYHIKKGKLHHAVVGADEKPVEAYGQPGGFDVFLKDYFNIEYRKAMYLIEIYIDFTLAGIAEPAAQLAAIGWTKASKIAKHMIAEGAKPEELLELAANNTVADLSEAIKDTVNVGGTPGEKVVRTTLKFRFHEAEGAAVTAILEAARDAFGLKDIADALSKIVTDWGTENAGRAATKEDAPAQRAAPAVKRAAPARAAVAAK